MTNAIYDIARNRFAIGLYDWRATALTLFGFSGPLDFNQVDTTIADIIGRGAVQLATSLPVAGQAVTVSGILQTGPVVMQGANSGSIVAQMIMAVTAVPDTASIPLFWLDDVDGLPYTLNGLDWTVQPDWSQSQGWAVL
jgi:hypothetical protein